MPARSGSRLTLSGRTDAGGRFATGAFSSATIASSRPYGRRLARATTR